jgi:hypothetical protein
MGGGLGESSFNFDAPSPGTGATLALSGVLVNQGYIALQGGWSYISAGAHHVTTGAIFATFINDGTVVVAPSGTFVVDSSSAISADPGDAGVFDISAQSTPTLADAVASSQTIAFLGSPASLLLGHAMVFSGMLDGLAPRDSIDFLHLEVTSASTSGTTLDIGLAGGSVLDLAMGAPLTGVSFGLAGDGNSGTILTLHQTMAAPAPRGG